MLLETAVLSCVVNLLLAGSLLGEQPLEDMVSPRRVYELTAHRVDSGRVGAWPRVEAHKASGRCLVRHPEGGCIERRLPLLGLLDDRLVEKIVANHTTRRRLRILRLCIRSAAGGDKVFQARVLVRIAATSLALREDGPSGRAVSGHEISASDDLFQR